MTVVLVVSRAVLSVVCQMEASFTGIIPPIAREHPRQHERKERLPRIQLTLPKRRNDEGAHCHLSFTLFSFLFLVSPPLRGYAANHDPGTRGCWILMRVVKLAIPQVIALCLAVKHREP